MIKYDFDKLIDRTNTNSMKYDFMEIFLNIKDKDLLPMWVADMDFECPKPVVEAIIKRAAHPIYGYSERYDSYFESVINWMKSRHNWIIKKDWILFTPGIVPAINWLIRTFAVPGDKVIIQPPVYYPFLNAILNNGCRPLFNPLKYENGKYTMDFKDLEEKVQDSRAKILILCSPHNPVGRVWEKEELSKLGEICIKNKVLIISDEIHSDLIYKNHKHTTFASISEEFAMNSITCTAPSKTFNTAGLQASNIIIQNDNLRKLFSNTLECNPILPNPFGIAATEAAYNNGVEWLEQLLLYLEENVNYTEKYIKENLPEINMIRPEGTYLVWLDFRKLGFDEKELEGLMIHKAKLVLDEGYVFGIGGSGFERINIACPRSVVEKALNRITDLVRSLKK
jgi:cystathionine beta-lyase